MDPLHLRPGYWLDRYELLCPLAYGGMASVWLARFGGRAGFERLVVVKMILPQYSQDPRFQEMFLDEARIASRIEHANVARILDVGEHANGHFIVMEWVDGDSLSKLMRAADQQSEPLPAGVALRICSDAAAGLHAAHSLQDRQGNLLGVVHRDVSPQNILVANTGATMLIDFGIAKARDRVSQDTSAGQLKGKVRYMAPEQALGRNVDHRADIWSLGTILYEQFAGVPAYDGDNEVATLHKLTSGAAPAPLPANVPGPIRSIIERALAYQVEDRFATAMELHLALEAAMVQIGEPSSIATVSAFARRLLVERQDLRRRTVDDALVDAHARDAARAQGGGAGAGGGSGPAMGMGMTNPGVGSTPMLQGAPSGPFPLTHTDGTGMLSTLGSAVVDYPSGAGSIALRPNGPKRIAAIAFGLCVLAGIIGAVLIVATTQARLKARETADTLALDGTPLDGTALAAPAPPPSAPLAETPTPTSAPVVSVTSTATVVDAGAQQSGVPTAGPTTDPVGHSSNASNASNAGAAAPRPSTVSSPRTGTNTSATGREPSHASSTSLPKTPSGGKKNRGF